MSRLEELIQELCPEGVEFFTVKELTKKKTIKTITPSIKIKRNDYQENGITPIISQELEYISGYCDFIDNNIPKNNYVCFGDHSEHIKFVDFAFVQGADGLKIMSLDEEKLMVKFFYYAISSFYVRHNNYERHFKYLNDTEIPVPPLEVQREIVRIMDSFTLLTAELTAELTARKKQYEYYRDDLLKFDHSIPMVTLRDVASFRNGKGHEKNIADNGKYVVINSKFISTNGQIVKTSDEQLSPLYTDDIAMVMSDLPNGRALAKCYLIGTDDKFTLNQRIGGFHTLDENKVITKYLFYILDRNWQLLKYDNGVDQTNLKKDDILNISIPVPAINVQKRLVYVLDNFDAICSDLNSGLPAEIEARQKQYEFYRDKLLSFKQL